ncbi:hypothetical protein LCGC14_2759190 [marine sediment metagenome]|uniref:Uncharacterized protein n=1 Tax=marine sediment metagenome TaxID=412755 RepID=A0A0F8YZI4_9ZZZZ
MKKWVEDPLQDSTIEWLLTSLEKEQTTTENALHVAYSIGVLSMGKESGKAA